MKKNYWPGLLLSILDTYNCSLILLETKILGSELNLSDLDAGVYLLRVFEKDKVATAEKEKTNFYELTGQYKFNSNLRTYVAFKLNNLRKGESSNLTDMDAEDSMRLGLRYDF